MTEVSVETCFANLRVLSFSLKFYLKNTFTSTLMNSTKFELNKNNVITRILAFNADSPSALADQSLFRFY